MKTTVGIICEYNPFHNGHLYQLSKIREAFSDCTIVCLMSGNFTERGELAMFDKYSRARAACECGADLVLELPFPFSIFSAEGYARSGIHIMNSLGIVDYLVFGCEENNSKILFSVAENLSSKLFCSALDDAVKSNPSNSYARLRENTYISLFGKLKLDLSAPNNILALEYIKALRLSKSSIKPFPILREGSGHDSDNPHHNIASASFIRNSFNSDIVDQYMPAAAINILSQAIQFNIERLFPALKYKLLEQSIPRGQYCFDSISGRASAAVCSAESFNDLYNKLSCKNLTSSYIRRGLVSALFGIEQSLFKTVPDFSLLLATNRIGRIALNRIETFENIRIFTKPSVAAKENPSAQREAFAEKILTLAADRPISPGYFMKCTPFIKG